jgi:hypothetical protein
MDSETLYLLAKSQMGSGAQNGLVAILATTGPPTAGLWLTGDIAQDSADVVWVCRSGGTPGTWVTIPMTGTNVLINGDFSIWQRGTTFTPGSVSMSITYTADRWCAQSSANNLTISQGTASPPEGFTSYAKIVTAAATTGDYWFFAQSIETANLVQFQGQVVTISFRYRMLVDSSTPMGLMIFYSTVTDENLIDSADGVQIALTAGSNVNPSGGAITNESIWTTGTATFTVPSTALSLAAVFTTIANTVNGAEFDVTGLKLELGSIATPFSRAGGSIGEELALCQRYYQVTSGTLQFSGNVTSGSSYYGVIPFKVTMRSVPTVTLTTAVYSGFSASASLVFDTFNDSVLTSRTATATGSGYFGDTATASAEL